MRIKLEPNRTLVHSGSSPRSRPRDQRQLPNTLPGWVTNRWGISGAGGATVAVANCPFPERRRATWSWRKGQIPPRHHRPTLDRHSSAVRVKAPPTEHGAFASGRLAENRKQRRYCWARSRPSPTHARSEGLPSPPSRTSSALTIPPDGRQKPPPQTTTDGRLSLLFVALATRVTTQILAPVDPRLALPVLLSPSVRAVPLSSFGGVLLPSCARNRSPQELPRRIWRKNRTRQ
uniref:Uncharacterized protein n=1 Tax=Plectus sambesii TaxID=2011161 RepID=A0A914UV24_9BILA